MQSLKVPIAPFLPCDPKTQMAVDTACVPLEVAKVGDLIGFRFISWHVDGSFQQEDIELVFFAGENAQPLSIAAATMFADESIPLCRSQINAFTAILEASFQPILEVAASAWPASIDLEFNLLEVTLMKGTGYTVDCGQDYTVKGRNLAFMAAVPSSHSAISRQPRITRLRSMINWSAIPHKDQNKIKIAPLHLPAS